MAGALSDQLIDRAGWWPVANRKYARRLMPLVAGHLLGYSREGLEAVNQPLIRERVLASYRSQYGNPIVIFILSAIASALIKMLIEWLIENWDANSPRLRELR